MSRRKIVAVGLLTEGDLQMLGQGFNRSWPVDDASCFSHLIQAIDEADRETWRARDRELLQEPLPLPRT